MNLKDYFVGLINKIVPKPDSHVTEWTFVSDKLPKGNERCEVVLCDVCCGKLFNQRVGVAVYLVDGRWGVNHGEVVICWKSIENVDGLFSNNV